MVGLWRPSIAACLQDAPCLLAGKAFTNNNINNNLQEKQELEEQRLALMEEVQSYRRRIKQLEDDLLFRLSNSQARYLCPARCLLQISNILTAIGLLQLVVAPIALDRSGRNSCSA